MNRFDCRPNHERDIGMDRGVGALRRGDTVVFPTDNVYGIGADAFSSRGVQRLNAAKGRSGGASLPVMVGAPRTLDGIVAGLSNSDRDLVDAFWPGPLTVVCRPQPSLAWDVAAADQTIAVRMPLHPIAIELLRAVGPLAVVTANRVGEPAPTDCDGAQRQLGDFVAVYLDAGPCEPSAVSTIVDLTGPPRVLRLGALSLEDLRAVAPDTELA